MEIPPGMSTSKEWYKSTTLQLWRGLNSLDLFLNFETWQLVSIVVCLHPKFWRSALSFNGGGCTHAAAAAAIKTTSQINQFCLFNLNTLKLRGSSLSSLSQLFVSCQNYTSVGLLVPTAYHLFCQTWHFYTADKTGLVFNVKSPTWSKWKTSASF
jgi:hypothetical protein